MSLSQKLTLSAAGLSALGVGLAITFAPHAFYAGSGVEIGHDPNLLSELRAPGANLAMLGAVIFAGVFRPELARRSAALGAAVFLAFAFGRVVGVAIDGPPGSGMLGALAFEVVIGALCLLALRRRSDPRDACAGRTATA